MSSGFNLVKAVLVAVICLSIIGSISQLVASLFALASAQDIENVKEQSMTGKCHTESHHETNRFIKLTELNAVIMLLMALITFTFELIGIIGAFRKSLAVLSTFGVVMCLSTIINCFIGSGGLKLLIILLDLNMTSLSAIYIFLIVR